MPETPVADEQAFVDKFVADAIMLIEMATEYARGGVENPQASANMRQLRVITTALSSALVAIPPVMAGIVPVAMPTAAQAPPTPPPNKPGA